MKFSNNRGSELRTKLIHTLKESKGIFNDLRDIKDIEENIEEILTDTDELITIFKQKSDREIEQFVKSIIDNEKKSKNKLITENLITFAEERMLDRHIESEKQSILDEERMIDNYIEEISSDKDYNGSGTEIMSKSKNENRIIKYIKKKYDDYIDSEGYNDLQQMLFLYEDDVELQQQREIFAYFHEYINSILENENNNSTGMDTGFEERLFSIFQKIKSFQKNLLDTKYSFILIDEYQKVINGNQFYSQLNIIEVEPIFHLNFLNKPSIVGKDLFEKLTKELFKNNKNLGLVFQRNVKFQSYENNILTWLSSAIGEDKKILEDSYALIKSFVQEVFGDETKIKNIKVDDSNSKEEREAMILKKDEFQIKKEDTREKFSDEEKDEILYNFNYKNILLKGVPGTGKSRTLDKIITNKKYLNLENHQEKNVLRINIHSASSNADLMQGIGISSNENGNIEYKEKQGLILEHIEKATFMTNQPFVLVLEEIQENSLNELIGDLIYLIEDSKRATKYKADNKEYTYGELIDEIIKQYREQNRTIDSVKLPSLISKAEKTKRMIVPHNLFIFCTSNYRDDRKVIEDNLLRRFEVIEIYPKYKDEIGDKFKSDEVSIFLKELNKSIVKVCSDNGEMHPDRFMIGHSIWLEVEDKKAFSRAFLKVITEFKDVKDMYFNDFKEITEDLTFPFDIEKGYDSYELWIKALQEECYTFLKSILDDRD